MIQNVDEEPEVERQEKIKKLKKQLQLLLEESEPKIYQFQQMTHYMTKQYCNYKFHQRMKNGIENIKISSPQCRKNHIFQFRNSLNI